MRSAWWFPDREPPLITALVVDARQLVKTLEQPSPSPSPGDASVPDPNRDVGSKAKKPKGKNLAHPPPSR
jgi:hypothetical protein